MRCVDKLEKEKKKGKQPYYTNETQQVNEKMQDQPTQQDYCKVVKKTKKDNVTHANIGEILLSQIPGISSTIATVIIKEFGTFHNMLKAIEKDREKCLIKIKYETNNGKMRHVSKTACSNIVSYLLDNKEQVLFVET